MLIRCYLFIQVYAFMKTNVVLYLIIFISVWLFMFWNADLNILRIIVD